MAEMNLLASGYGGVEGPTFDQRGVLYFSDSVSGGIYCLHPDGRVETVVPKRKGAGGIVLHAEGGIVISGRDLSHVRDGESRVIVTREDVPTPVGTRTGGFNDITADLAGRVFAGATRFTEDGTPVPGELFMVTAAHETTLVYDDVGMTNGVAQSVDGCRLFHADTERRRIIVSDMTDDTVPVPVTEFTTDLEGRPDGVAVDVDGGLWVAWGRYVLRFDPEGLVDERLEVPSEHTLNCCFGGDDMTDLYITTMGHTEQPELGGCVYRTTVGVRGGTVGVARL